MADLVAVVKIANFIYEAKLSQKESNTYAGCEGSLADFSARQQQEESTLESRISPPKLFVAITGI